MIHIFHGEHHQASRKELVTLKLRLQKNDTVVLDGKIVTLTQLTQATESNSIFGEEKLIIVENLLSKRLGKKNSEGDVIKKWIAQIPKEVIVVFWEEKEIGKTILNIFPKDTDIAIFKPDKTIFNLVESLTPHNQSKTLRLLSQALSEEDPEFIFVMVVRQIRLLLMSKKVPKASMGLSPWQLTKVYKQAELYTPQQLRLLYQKLLDIDGTIKNGVSAFTIRQHLELFVAFL